jgi:mannose-1-phosphate guanylyltransferase
VRAAGLATRLRPLSDRWPKPVLPIDGMPVVVTLVHELAAAGLAPITVVTGHLAQQVEELLRPLPYELRFVRQPEPLGSADALRRAAAAAPFVDVAADTRFASGDIGRFVAALGDADGAIAIRRQPGRPDHTRVRVEHGRIRTVVAPDAPDLWTAAPLQYLGDAVAGFLHAELAGPPYEVAEVFQRAIDAGARVSAIQVGRTRDLTSPVDLVRENFPYLRDE